MYFCLRGIYYKHDQKYKGGIMRKTVLQGALGEALMRTVNERLKKVDYDQLVEPFKLRNEADGAWRCEFWGKIVR